MTQPRKHTARLLLAVLAALPGVPALAFDLDSDVPITVSAGNARLDDAQGVATYTGEVELYAQGPGKAEAIERLAANRDIDLDGSWASSDSATDLPMLDAVGHPVAVNPDRELRRIAEVQGWLIREFENPLPLGDRVPIDRNWIVASALSLLVVVAFVTTVRRLGRRSSD